MNNEKAIRTNYIFIDFENVQPSSLNLPKNMPFKVFIFVGAKQKKLPIKLAISMQNLGENAEYILVDNSGKNILDFYITFYLGKLSEKDPKGYFHIITKDTGFDMLIKHLREKKVLVNRYDEIDKISIIKCLECKTLTTGRKVELIVNHLIKRGDGKPKTVTTLSNFVNTICAKQLNDNQLKSIIDFMVKEEFIYIDEGKIIYRL